MISEKAENKKKIKKKPIHLNSQFFFQNDKILSSPKDDKQRVVNCVRCKTSLSTKEDLRKHLETCSWKCPNCDTQLRDPKAIKIHRNKCGKNNHNLSSEVNNGEKGELLTGLACKICQRQCKHFHYLKGHMCMHYR